MSTVQKIIKYLALALAVFIIVSIASSILFGIYSLSTILGLTRSINSEIKTENKISNNFEDCNIKTLKIDLAYSSLIIKNGNTLKTESDNSNITCSRNNSELVIKENSSWFYKDEKTIIVYIPENMTFDNVKLETGAGRIKIEELNTKELSFSIGAGEVEIQKLNVLDRAKIDGGAGKVSVLSGQINDLDLDMGVGKFQLQSKLTGRNDIDAGVGKLDLRLLDIIDNYTIKIEKGIGSITINGKETFSNTQYGNGDTYIDINGGIGSIEIKSNV